MTTILLAILAGIALLLLLILYFRVQAFLSLLLASMVVGILAGLSPDQLIDTVQRGMGGTLGFVATVVGLGAMFGAILEHTGGATAISTYLLRRMGERRAPLAMALAGFFIAIPVFFDVAFIILVPMLYALQRRTGKSLFYFAIPLLAGLAVTHAFVPPTPGPVAVADIIGVDLGSVILIGFVAGIPTVLVSGLWFGRYVSKRIMIEAPPLEQTPEEQAVEVPPVGLIGTLIGLPIALILLRTLLESGILPTAGSLVQVIALLGHPFSALILANLLAWYLLGIRRGLKKEALFQITTKSMAPAGTIILLTGAGGVFKQVLVDTGAGEMLAGAMADLGIPIIVFAFLGAAVIRVIQGSATVAMITGAGLVAPLLTAGDLSNWELACLVVAIASGASIFSHVNDSGFWLVGQYLGISEKQTFRSWSLMMTILALTGFSMALLMFSLF